MSATKLPCGCEYVRDGRERETLTKLCIPHKKEFDQSHAAAVATCSHVNRDLLGE
jgi:hypothetical protein